MVEAVGEVTRVTTACKSILKSASALIPGGLAASCRGWYGAMESSPGSASPLVITKGKGAAVTDADGNQYLDYIGGHGSLILGHADDRVVAAITKAASKGFAHGAPVDSELRLVELVVGRHTAIDWIRLTGTPPEALRAAIMCARTQTERHLVVITDGYSGEIVCRGAAVEPKLKQAAQSPDYMSVPRGELPALERLLTERGHEIAAIVLEPVGVSTGLSETAPDYLQSARSLCDRHGVWLIFDETVTAFRTDTCSGADVTPELTLLGPIIGGGLPLAAYGGPAAVLKSVESLPPAGACETARGHELAIAAGIATLQAVGEAEFYSALDAKSTRLEEGLIAAANAHGAPMTITRVSSILALSFPDDSGSADMHSTETKHTHYFRWQAAMLDRGVLLPPSPGSCIFLSAAHSDEDIDRTIESARDALMSIAH